MGWWHAIPMAWSACGKQAPYRALYNLLGLWRNLGTGTVDCIAMQANLDGQVPYVGTCAVVQRACPHAGWLLTGRCAAE